MKVSFGSPTIQAATYKKMEERIDEAAYRRVEGEVAGLIGNDPPEIVKVLTLLAARTAAAEGVTSADIEAMDGERLREALLKWTKDAGVTLIEDDKTPRKRAKAKNADIGALPTDVIRVSAPTYGAIGGADMEPSAKWLTDELIALFPAPITEYKYADISPDITPNKYGDSVTITAEQIGAYALSKYGRNEKKQRDAIVKTLIKATQSVVMDYKNADGEDRRYVGSLFTIDAPNKKGGETIGGLQFPVTIRASDVFRLYVKSKYGHVSLVGQRARLTDKGFGEYEAIKGWAASIEPYRAQALKRGGAYTRAMPYEFISGYMSKSKGERSKIRQRMQEAAAAYAGDYSTEKVTIKWQPDGHTGIRFTWTFVKK